MDNHTPEQRRRNMKAVKNKGSKIETMLQKELWHTVKNKGSKIETMLQKELWHRGLRYRKNAKTVYGKPDIAFIGKRIAVFCDSEFFHGYDWKTKTKK